MAWLRVDGWRRLLSWPPPNLEKSLQKSGHDSCSLFRRWHCNFDTPFKKEKSNQRDTNVFPFNKVVPVGQCKYFWQSFHAALYFPLHVIKCHGILRKRIRSPRTVQIAMHREFSICFILILQCQKLQQYKKEKKIHHSCERMFPEQKILFKQPQMKSPAWQWWLKSLSLTLFLKGNIIV